MCRAPVTTNQASPTSSSPHGDVKYLNHPCALVGSKSQMMRFTLAVVIFLSVFATTAVALTWLEFRLNQTTWFALSGARAK
jgi:hypothetical protein